MNREEARQHKLRRQELRGWNINAAAAADTRQLAPFKLDRDRLRMIAMTDDEVDRLLAEPDDA